MCLCYRILLMFLKNERMGDSRTNHGTVLMTHLVTTLIVLTQNFIPLKRFSSVINIINLVPLCPISKTRLIRVFARIDQIL